MSVITDTLDGVTLSVPRFWANLVMFPLLADADETPDYLVLDEALRRQTARVTEISEGGSVPELAFENDNDLSVLLLDGEELVGARQNRVLNSTVLVGGKRKLNIPVSCVEHGRWRYNSSEFASADRALFAKARAKKMQRVSESLRESGSYRSDQGEVWDDIAEKSAAFHTLSPTAAMGDVFEQERPRLETFVAALTPVATQRGALFAIDGQLVGMELFDCPQTFAHYLPKLVRSYAMDAVETRAPQTLLPEAAVAQAFLREAGQSTVEAFAAVGEGEDLRLDGAALVGSALVHQGRVVHLAAFRADARRGPRTQRSALRRRLNPPAGDAREIL